jgi:SAM-dependent methyltransferase
MAGTTPDPAEPAARPQKKFSSAAYWRRRYAKGGNSGAGSYGRLADYKAGYINDLVQREKIASVVEFGSGDGNQASLFAFDAYTGIDLSPDAIAACSKRFADRPGWAFRIADDAMPPQHDLAMSLDVIYHLTEDSVFDAYMRRLFGSAKRFVLIYASDHDSPASAVHVRHRNFSAWVARNFADWHLIDAPEHPFPLTAESNPKQTSFASFKLFKAP